MKRSLLVFGLVSAFALISAPAQASSASPSPEPTISAPASASPEATRTAKHEHRGNLRTSLSPAKKAALEAARAAFQASLKQAQDGRDLAFADANANLQQSLQLAGKDRAAKKAAHEAYKAAATGIVTAFKQAISMARVSYKAALQTIDGK